MQVVHHTSCCVLYHHYYYYYYHPYDYYYDFVYCHVFLRLQVWLPWSRVVSVVAAVVVTPQELAAVVVYLEEVYLVTALVPSETACFASSPGSKRRTAV